MTELNRAIKKSLLYCKHNICLKNHSVTVAIFRIVQPYTWPLVMTPNQMILKRIQSWHYLEPIKVWHFPSLSSACGQKPISTSLHWWVMSAFPPSIQGQRGIAVQHVLQGPRNQSLQTCTKGLAAPINKVITTSSGLLSAHTFVFIITTPVTHCGIQSSGYEWVTGIPYVFVKLLFRVHVLSCPVYQL